MSTARETELHTLLSDPLRRVLCRLIWGTPLLLPLVATVGAICGWEKAGGEWWGWVVALVVLIVAHVLHMWRMALCCLLCVGVVVVTQQSRRESADEVLRLCETGQALALRGTVVRELGSGCILETGWLGARVALRGEGPWNTGDVLQVVASRQPTTEAPVPGMFSTPEWMRQQGLCANLFCLSAEKVGESHGWSSLVRHSAAIRNTLADRLMPPGTEADVRRQVLCALVLGEKGRSERDTIDIFRRSGCLHAFAVSGLHVGLVAAILFALMKRSGLPLRFTQIALLLLVAFYVFVTGLSVPALRAYLLLLALSLGTLLGRRKSYSNIWCCTALLILLVEPWQLLQPGYQLSFIVYAVICAGSRYVMNETPWFGPDSYLPRRLHTCWERCYMIAERTVRGAIIVAFSAWLISLPFSLAQFHSISIASYIINLAITPLLPLVMATGLCAMLAAGLPLLGAASQYLALKSAGLLVSLVSLGGLQPGIFIPAQPPQPPDAALLVGMSYGKSFCILGNPGILLGDTHREADARFHIEPALFHAGFTPILIWSSHTDAAEALALYRRNWPTLQQVPPSTIPRHYSGHAGEFYFYFPPQPQRTKPGQEHPIVLWQRPNGQRVLYLGNAAASTLESMPPQERRADIIILGSHPYEPLLDPAILRSMSPTRVIFLPSASPDAIPPQELAPARTEILSADSIITL